MKLTFLLLDYPSGGKREDDISQLVIVCVCLFAFLSELLSIAIASIFLSPTISSVREGRMAWLPL